MKIKKRTNLQTFQEIKYLNEIKKIDKGFNCCK